ncbi:peptidyl-prolyl cis-trans isomerase D [Mesocricetibacter intestinalis]|uniref:Periplasmic chaperone PpiD n=1 Tax=Mesocricetibacter intestinalis TaxID=1521930 RepID=A0A4R6VB80_9PAST|nr:peptidylprolyl isomerase [Mesocricetibacter intestinalis]TDQ59498.1 peptidyl-prolyl cis-trans isomerase D [Mesocricetibacter intestinalis]
MVMEKLHGASNNIMAKILFGLISVAFVMSGTAGYLMATADNSAAKVNGEEISQQVFQRQYNQEYQRLSELYGANFSAIANTPEFTEQIKSRVLNRLIDQELLRQYTDELQLSADDESIKRYIVNSPEFQTQGKFDNNLYQQLLRSNEMTPDQYAAYVREGIRLSQLQEGLAETDFEIAKQQDELIKLYFQQRDIRLAPFPLKDEIAKQAVSEQEIEDYYNANKAAFLLPEQVKVQYLDLNGQSIAKSVKVTDVEIQQYYQDNKSLFVKGQQHLAHIQFTHLKDAEAAYQALQQGTEFAALAKEKSEDKPSAANGGDLGWLSSGDLPKAFENAALELAVDEYSRPQQIDGNYHIIKVLERKGGEVQPLAAVKEQIAQTIRQELINSKFYAIEKNVAEKAFENPESLQPAAQAANLEIRETGYFSRSEIPQELNFPSVANAIFNSDISQGGMNSEAINVGEQHSIVVRVLEHKAETTRTLEDAKADIETYLKRQKAESAVLAQAQNAVQQLSQHPDKTPNGLKFGAAQSWGYAQNNDPVLNNVIFAMPLPAEGKSVYQAAQTGNGDVVVIALDKVHEGKLSAEERQQFEQQARLAQQVNLQANLLKSLRNKAKIEINEDFMRRADDN